MFHGGDVIRLFRERLLRPFNAGDLQRHVFQMVDEFPGNDGTKRARPN